MRVYIHVLKLIAPPPLLCDSHEKTWGLIMKNFLTLVVTLLVLPSIGISEKTTSNTTPPVKCESLGQTQCGGTCTSYYGGEGKCVWTLPEGVSGGSCVCAPIQEPSLKCNCPSRAQPNLMCDSPCSTCTGGCYKGQSQDSKCFCSSSCSSRDPRTGLYRFYGCDCEEGTCAKKTATDITEANSTEF